MHCSVAFVLAFHALLCGLGPGGWWLVPVLLPLVHTLLPLILSLVHCLVVFPLFCKAALSDGVSIRWTSPSASWYCPALNSAMLIAQGDI